MIKWYFAIVSAVCIIIVLTSDDMAKEDKRMIALIGFISICVASILQRIDNK